MITISELKLTVIEILIKIMGDYEDFTFEKEKYHVSMHVENNFQSYNKNDSSSYYKPFETLLILGLSPDITSFEIKRNYQKYRPNLIKLVPSESKETNCAVLTFSKSYLRDAALLYGNSFDHARKVLIPLKRNSQTIESPNQSEILTPEEFDNLKDDSIISFIYQGKSYSCSKSHFQKISDYNLNAIESNPRKEIHISLNSEITEDFYSLIQYIHGNPLIVSESNIVFLNQISSILQISALTSLDTLMKTFFNENNVVLFANQLRKTNNLVSFYQFLETLFNDNDFILSNRYINFPINILSIILSSPVVRSVVPMRIMKGLTRSEILGESKTPILQQISFEKCDANTFFELLNDPTIDFTSINKSFLQALPSIYQSPPYISIEYEPAFPFQGIFNYLSNICGKNPHIAGLINIEAPTVQASQPHSIIDSTPHACFATRDIPGQWIKSTCCFNRIYFKNS